MVGHGGYSCSRRLFVDLGKLKMFCTHRQRPMEFKNDPTDFYENMTVPLECLKSKQGNRLVIYRPHYTFSAFQKASEKGPASARSDCKHTTDSIDTLFLNAVGLFPLALTEKPTP